MSETDDSSREYDPTPHKLKAARKRGDLPRSVDISTACGYLGLLVAALIFGKPSLLATGSILQAMISAEPLKDHKPFETFFSVLWPLAPWAAIPAVLVVIGLIGQRALVVAPEKLMPKLSRINPIENAKQKFGLNGLFEFAKGSVKLGLFATILGVFFASELPTILLSQNVSPRPAIALMLHLVSMFLILIAIASVCIAGPDYLWQRASFLRRNRMSRKELTDEMKQSEGDPHIKSMRRQKAIEIANRQMISDVAKASVVIVNPTHYAVALKWERGLGRAPVCLAKGMDEVAARIRQVARENAIPIHSDPPTARALYAAVNVGAEIHPEHYRAVATAIRFAERIRSQARKKGGVTL